MKFTPIHHQFSLLDYNDMKPNLKIPIKRISKERYDQALKELRGGNEKRMRNILRDINDALENFNKRLTNGRQK